MRVLLVLLCASLLVSCANTWTGGVRARFGWSEERGLRAVDVPDGPARLAGLRPGDRIVAVDGERVVGAEYEHVVELLRGPVGTFVVLTVSRLDGEEESEHEVRVERMPYSERSTVRPSGYRAEEVEERDRAHRVALGLESPDPEDHGDAGVSEDAADQGD